MKLIEPKIEIIQQEPNLEGIYKQIEQAARTCYKSEDKITNTSAKEFVDRLIKNKHFAMLEHGTVYLKVPVEIWQDCWHEWVFMFPDVLPWISIDCDGKYHYITTNLRHIIEDKVDMKTVNTYWCEPTKFHEKRYTLKFTTSIGITRELIRHRHFSFANESTRYCNYSRDKFDNEITFVMPEWYIEHKYSSFKLNEFDRYLEKVEDLYMFYMDCELQPQEAREVLPLCTKSELVMTGFESDWKEFFDKRLKGTTGKPHPDMIHLCKLAQEELTKNNIKFYD